MKKVSLAALSAVGIFLVVLTAQAWGWSAQTQPTYHPVSIENRIVVLTGSDVAKDMASLNAAGKEGWTLVTVVDQRDPSDNRTTRPWAFLTRTK